MDGWISTYSGAKFWLFKPTPEMITIGDVGHALAHLCRFNGHCRKFYSVAQHSVLVSHLVPEKYALHGLLHDGAEAYCSDLVSPLKHYMPEYQKAEAVIETAINKKFSLKNTKASKSAVKHADLKALATEARDLTMLGALDWKIMIEPLPIRIKPWTSRKAKEEFLKRYYTLTGQNNG